MQLEVLGQIEASSVSQTEIKGKQMYRHSFKVNTMGGMWFTVLGSNPEKIPLGVKTKFFYSPVNNNGKTYNNVTKETFKIKDYVLDPDTNGKAITTNQSGQSTQASNNKKSYDNNESIIRQNALRHATQIVTANDWMKNKTCEEITAKTIQIAEQIFHYSKDGSVPAAPVQSSPNVVADDFVDDFDNDSDEIPF